MSSDDDYDEENIGDSTTFLRSSKCADSRWDIFMEGLLSYHAKHGSILVRATFVFHLPTITTMMTTWPVATQGLPLGSMSNVYDYVVTFYPVMMEMIVVPFWINRDLFGMWEIIVIRDEKWTQHSITTTTTTTTTKTT